MIPCPKPGIYRGVPFDIYQAWDALSSSDTKLILKTPAHYLDRLTHPPEPPTPSLILGTALHIAILEPESFEDSYEIPDTCSAITGKKARCSKLGTICRQTPFGPTWYCSTHSECDSDYPASNRTRLTSYDYNLCLNIRDRVRAHPAAGVLLRQASPKTVEICIVWECRVTGALCKARLDLASFEAGESSHCLADLKSCQDASRRAFVRSIFKFGYHIQSAHYLDGCATLGFAFPGFVNIAFETQRPYGVACYWQEQSMLDVGMGLALKGRQLYVDCKKSENYPCYSDRVERIELERWMENIKED